MTNQEAIELITNLKPTNCTDTAWNYISSTMLEVLAKKDPAAKIDSFTEQFIKFYNK